MWKPLFLLEIIKRVFTRGGFSDLLFRLQDFRSRKRQWRLPMIHFTVWERVYGHVILIRHIASHVVLRQVVSGQIAITNIQHMLRLAVIKSPVSAGKII